MCISNNGKYTKHTRHISRRMHFVRNVEDYNLHNPVWSEGGLQLVDIVTKNFRECGLNTRLGYAIVWLENLHNTCTRGFIRDRRVWRTIFSDDYTGLSLNGPNSMILKCQWFFNDEKNIEKCSKNCSKNMFYQCQENHL